MATKVDPLSYVNVQSPKALAGYRPVVNNVAPYTPGTYQSAYADQLAGTRDTVTNWKYDPLQDASYQALAKIYGARGNRAAKDTLADAAALNGGYQTSYAVSAAQQARNQYNQELAALIPDLENTAYNRALQSYNLYKDADDTDYGRFRDTEGDRQWKYSQDYQAWRDREADNQWLYNNLYQQYRDLMADYQWGLNYNQGVYGMRQAAAKASSGGGGGGGRSGGSGGGGGGYSGGGGGGGSAPTQEKYEEAKTAPVVKTKDILASVNGIVPKITNFNHAAAIYNQANQGPKRYTK